ncbi:MAG: carboxypeptidase regulatory-like domain-containing protein [Chloracidobacterium sp.]|nr:carboxypeptidase regulatory-like domain-containing protein [Chloracidobacterium sp.]
MRRAIFRITRPEGQSPMKESCGFRKGIATSPRLAAEPRRNARIVQVASIMAYLLIALPFTTITANAQTKGAITGRVVADDGSGMADVTVMLRPVAAPAGPLGSYSRSTTTDEEGNFRFADLPARPYDLLVFSSREYTQAPAVTGSGERRYYRIGESVHITLIRGGVITGRVTNPLGGPVIAIQVTAIRVRDHEGRPVKDIIGATPRRTDDRGVYRIYGLQPGSYVVVANSNSNRYGAQAYYNETPTYYPSSTRDAASEVTVTIGSEAAGVDIRYRGEPGHAVSGGISGAKQSGPSAPVVVYLIQAATGTVFDSTYNNSNSFAFYGVPDGEYELTAEEDVRADGAASQPRRLTVRGADVTGIELKLSPTSSIAGKIVFEPLPQRCEEKSAPAPEEIVLRARRDEAGKTPLVANLFSPRDAVADEKGKFTITPLAPSRYHLQALLPGENWYLKSITAPAPALAGGAAPLSAADIGRSGVVLKSGDRASGITVTIAEGAAGLRGRMTPEKEGARLPAKLVVHLVPADAGSAENVLRYAEVVAERDGMFEFKHAAPGRYLLTVRAAPDGEPAYRPFAPVAWDANERAKLRKEAEAMKIEVELNPCQRASEQVVRYR